MPQGVGTCSIDGCERTQWSRGWCGTHYQRWRKNGSLSENVPIRTSGFCSVDGCSRKRYAQGVCNPHYHRLRTRGDTLPDLPIRTHSYKPGDVVIDGNGYAVEKLDVNSPFWPMTRDTGWVRQHRLVKAQEIGRLLFDSEEVHHIDGNKLNNDPSNLQLRTRQHGSGIAVVCGDCGSENVIATEIRGD